MDYAELLKYCQSGRQEEILKAVIKYGSNVRAAPHLGVTRRSVDKAVNLVKQYAARKGYSPEHDMTRTVPDGFKLRGTSTLYDKKREHGLAVGQVHSGL